jgi:peroxiredoxin Q/BCP
VSDSTLPAVGSVAPAFTAVTDADVKVKLSEYKGKWVVLFFYPKDDTPG